MLKNVEYATIVFLLGYWIMGTPLSYTIGSFINSWLGKISLIVLMVVLYKFMHPIIVILAAFIVYKMMINSEYVVSNKGLSVGLDEYAPKQMGELDDGVTPYTFPYTLEQEMVEMRAPLVKSGLILANPSYTPHEDDTHEASSL